jgi:MFS family permease
MKNPKITLAIIVFAQFCCTSLWFAGNSVIKDLIQSYGLEISALSHLTSAVQFGFISGTLLFAILTITDRFSPSKVFFMCAILGALFNLGILWPENNLFTLFIFRFLTGLFLAGIYPVGMKIAADYFEKGLGKSLGFLVGALVLGTAFPHLLKGFDIGFNWRIIVLFTSTIAVLGGLLIRVFIKDGPYRKPGQKPDLSAWLTIFKHPEFRSSAFGYFGHMWELYAFWAFVPLMVEGYLNSQHLSLNTSFTSFLIIGLGCLGCVFGGFLTHFFHPKRIATIALTLSGICCLTYPLIYQTNNEWLFIGFLIFWGIVVITDSPMFSTLVAQNANPNQKGTALTMVNCIGFSITIISIQISIQLINLLFKNFDSPYIFMILAIGPALGLIALLKPQNS